MTTPERPTARITRGGLLATLLLLVVVLVCVRLGFWQLARRQERSLLNQRVAARMDQPPLGDPAALADTAASLYRIGALAGDYDVERSIVLPGRSLRGAPGVHLLTPLRITPDRAVLVNRGWVPAADGASIPMDSFPLQARAARGLVLPFPAGRERAPVHDAVADSGFRVTWFNVDPAALRAQFPYELMPFMLQLLPEPGAPRYPRRLEPPALDAGPHLGYAIQWFGFAIIGVIGWLALLRRGRHPPRTAPPAPLALAFAGLALLPAVAHAQLRPLDPFEWRILETGHNVVGSFGSGITFDQPVPLAGSEGRLLELGSYRLLWRSGRMGIDVAGVAVWHHTQQDSLEPPAAGVRPPENGVRKDFGPAIASAFIRLSSAQSSTALLVRFGARLPTTSHHSGLERDETDFFALAGARWGGESWALAGEAGVGIHGTVRDGYRQSDVLIYNVGLRRTLGPAAASASLVGHLDGHDWRVRGNEDLSELRLGLQAGRSRWVQATYVRGVSGYSPDYGFYLGVGFATGCAGDCLP